MKRALLFVIVLLVTFTAYAERIDGPANVRTAPKGTPIISLNDNVEIDCSELDNNWYRIVINLKITMEQYDSDRPIEKGDSLFNRNDEFIGTALVDIPDSLQNTWYSGGAPDNPLRFGLDIYASTFKSNIKPESIAELRLNAILYETDNKAGKEELTDFMNEFGFINDGLLGRLVEGYEEQMIYQSTVVDPSPLDRIRLIFEGTQLVAIVHTRPLSQDLKSTPLVRGRKIIVFKNMSPTQLKEFLDINQKGLRRN